MEENRRINEIMDNMKSFSKERYYKEELLGEYMCLQSETVDLTFNGEHASTAKLRTWDVVNHLKQLNEDCGNVADDELRIFQGEAKKLCNLIKAEYSGNRGECKAYKTLEHLETKNIVLKNIELCENNIHTELDAIVITPGCLTIVEVKNTSKDIFIDEEGNYYITGEFLRCDCNIAKKMEIKEKLLKNILDDSGYGQFQINSIVVFTNNKIEVRNKYHYIRTCFANQLPYVIDECQICEAVSFEDMNIIKRNILKAERKESYPTKFDANQYKMAFAKLMAKLELAMNLDEKEIEEKTVKMTNISNNSNKEKTLLDTLKSRLLKNEEKQDGSIAVALTTMGMSIVSEVLYLKHIAKSTIG